MTAPHGDDCRLKAWAGPLGGSSGSAVALSQALHAVYSLHLPLAEQRRLAGRALGLVLQPSDRAAVRDRSVIPEAFELALLEVGRIMGKSGKATVTEAKQHLRRFGAAGAKLASKLGRLSKLRNAEVHDVSFAAELAELVRNEPVATVNETSSEEQRAAEPECELDLYGDEVAQEGIQPQPCNQALDQPRADMREFLREYLDKKFGEIEEQLIIIQRGVMKGKLVDSVPSAFLPTAGTTGAATMASPTTAGTTATATTASPTTAGTTAAATTASPTTAGTTAVATTASPTTAGTADAAATASPTTAVTKAAATTASPTTAGTADAATTASPTTAGTTAAATTASPTTAGTTAAAITASPTTAGTTAAANLDHVKAKIQTEPPRTLDSVALDTVDTKAGNRARDQAATTRELARIDRIDKQLKHTSGLCSEHVATLQRERNSCWLAIQGLREDRTKGLERFADAARLGRRSGGPRAGQRP